MRTIYEGLGWRADIDRTPLLAGYEYLRVSASEHTILMVLGYAEETASGRLETWYSRSGQVLRLKDGRVHSTMGFPVDWTAVRYEALPSWGEVLRRPRVPFVRYRDETPGYRVDVFDIVAIRAVQAPKATQLRGWNPAQLQWFEESTERELAENRPPSARYALNTSNGQATLIYSEQCLAQGFCLAWQRWPAIQ